MKAITLLELASKISVLMNENPGLSNSRVFVEDIAVTGIVVDSDGDIAIEYDELGG